MDYLTTNTDLHQYWSWKFRQKERNKPSEELMSHLTTDYPNIESLSSTQLMQLMKDYQDAQYRGEIPATVIPSPRIR